METERCHDGRVKASCPHSLILLAITGLTCALLAAMCAAGSGLGTAWHWWDFRKGFVILRYTTYLGIVAVVVSVISAVLSFFKGARAMLLISMAGIFVGVFVVCVPLSWWLIAKRVPPIHDISTDTKNPPRFISILPLRKNAANLSEYAGPEAAKLQHEFYPDIQPVFIALPPTKAFEQALRAVLEMKWQIIDANESQGRIEATATTKWFRFKDDVIIRIERTDGRSRIDIRSVSRVGKSDLGANAKRIRAYIKALKECVPCGT